MDQRIRVGFGDRSYTIWIERGLLTRSGELLAQQVQSTRVLVVTDENVAALYLDKLAGSLIKAGFEIHEAVIAPGEGSKSLSVVSDLYDRLASLSFHRDEVVVGFGGGVVGDLAGFVASTWLRGVPFVQVPTTVLAQVDSSVGGKVGINHAAGKNLIGSFYQPILVMVDPTVLTTLPERELWAGLAEVVKYGFIADERLFTQLEGNLDNLVGNPGEGAWTNILGNCCRIKARVVEQDERDFGIRHILNFGHTIGHAIEAATGYERYRHGEAIVLGMRVALWLSHWNSGLPEGDLERGLKLLSRFPVTVAEELTPQRLLSYLTRDKKRTTQGQKWVLLQQIGQAAVASGLPTDSVLKAISRVLE